LAAKFKRLKVPYVLCDILCAGEGRQLKSLKLPAGRALSSTYLNTSGMEPEVGALQLEIKEIHCSVYVIKKKCKKS